MPHIMEPDVLRSYRFQNFIVGPPKGVRVVHCSSLWRREHIWIARVLFVFLYQEVHSLLGNRQRPNGVMRFRWTDHQPPLDAVDLFRNGDCSGLGIQVRLKEGQQLSPSQARRQFQIKRSQQSPAFRLHQIHTDLLLRQDTHLLLYQLRQFATLSRIHED